jgi:hypothetical protein
MLLTLPDDDHLAVLGALGSVCTADGPLTDAGAAAITSFAELGLGASAPDPARLPSTTPEQLAAALPDLEAVTTITEVLAVAALVDGDLDDHRIDRVLTFAEALGSDSHWLGDLALSKQDDLSPVIADMGDRNLRSVTDGRLDLAHIDDINRWLMPYEGDRADQGLADRYRNLAGLPVGSLGYEFWSFYDRHHFVFPGQAGAVNEIFATPHDCTHLLSGYDTTPQGELLVSTFTARMHPVFPMEGHILPVIYSWHLGIEFNQLAGSYRGALDPAKFWVAWERGRATVGDTFATGFDFWERVEQPLDAVRAEAGVPPLDAAHAATSDAVAGVDYRPIP